MKRLKIPLGDWIKGNNYYKWKTYQHPIIKDLYRNTEIGGKETWRKHRSIKNKEDIFNNSPGIKCKTPKYAYRISLKSQHKTYVDILSSGRTTSSNGKHKVCGTKIVRRGFL